MIPYIIILDSNAICIILFNKEKDITEVISTHIDKKDIPQLIEMCENNGGITYSKNVKMNLDRRHYIKPSTKLQDKEKRKLNNQFKVIEKAVCIENTKNIRANMEKFDYCQVSNKIRKDICNSLAIGELMELILYLNNSRSIKEQLAILSGDEMVFHLYEISKQYLDHNQDRPEFDKSGKVEININQGELDIKESNVLTDYNINKEYLEGHKKEVIHICYERNKKLIEMSKKKFISDKGKLYCEVCNFDFLKKYGERGKNFIEAHHNKPVSELEEKHSHIVKISDIKMICSNCHRIIHRNKPWLTIEELKQIIQDNN